jgi:GMP synthase (glutamine-hydrolysing)
MSSLRAAVVAFALCLVPSLASAGPLIGIEDTFDRPATIGQASGPIVCIVDTEHPDVIRERLRAKSVDQYKGRVLKQRVMEITGLPCVLVHYTEAHREDVEQSNVKAILLTARHSSLDPSLDREWFAMIRETKIPMIGFCGGHQLIAQAFGGDIDRMRPLLPNEPDPRPQYHPGFYKEWGFMKVNLLKADPLFDGLVASIVVREMHAFEITKLPAEFDTLAATDECPVQVIRHRLRPLYGTQFHPEAFDDEHPDGRKLLENFFKIAGAMK